MRELVGSQGRVRTGCFEWDPGPPSFSPGKLCMAGWGSQLQGNQGRERLLWPKTLFVFQGEAQTLKWPSLEWAQSDCPSSSKCHQGGSRVLVEAQRGSSNPAWRTALGWRGGYWRIPKVISQFSGLILIKVCLSLASGVWLTRVSCFVGAFSPLSCCPSSAPPLPASHSLAQHRHFQALFPGIYIEPAPCVS